MEEILTLAAALSGAERDDPTLAALCQAAQESLKLRLKEGITPEECGKAFAVAAAAIAAKGWQEGVSKFGVSSFAAGSLSLTVEENGDRFVSAAMSLLEPWMKDAGFGFRGV